IMTQGELAEAIYGDKLHTPNIYSALMSLVNSNNITRSGAYPAKYSLRETPVSEQAIIIKKNSLSELENTEVQQCKTQQRSITMSAEYATHLILDYFNETMKDGHGRYMSWRHCYKAFSENRNIIDEQTVDYLALHLAFYLASWGMYRGSSFLLQKDYKVHIPIVRIIQEEKYNVLFGISAEDLCKRSNLALLDEIGTRIKSCYTEERPAFNGAVNNATDTLITKILLGTLGCVPAYDRYYVQSVKKYHISSGRYNRDSIYCVAKFYCDNLDEFEKLRHEINKCGIEYPPMKLMDMCFWQDAYIDDLKKR
ncbi:hypothetical protein, partial [Anaerotignum sp.]